MAGRDIAPISKSYPALCGRGAVVKGRVTAISPAPADDFRRDSDLFLECARNPETQRRMGICFSVSGKSRCVPGVSGAM